MNDCRTLQSELSAYLDGEVAELRRREIERHLATCDGCRARLAGLRELARGVAALPRLPVPPQFLADVRQKIAAPAARSWAERLFRPVWLKVPLEALALVAVLATVTVVYRSPQRSAHAPAAVEGDDELRAGQRLTATEGPAQDAYGLAGRGEASSATRRKQELAWQRPAPVPGVELDRDQPAAASAPAPLAAPADRALGLDRAQLSAEAEPLAKDTKLGEVDGLANGPALTLGFQAKELAEPERQGGAWDEETRFGKKLDPETVTGPAGSGPVPPVASVTGGGSAGDRLATEPAQVRELFDSAGVAFGDANVRAGTVATPVATQIQMSATDVEAARGRVAVVTANNQGRVLRWDGQRQVVHVELPAANVWYFQNELTPVAMPAAASARPETEQSRMYAARPLGAASAAQPEEQAGRSNAPVILRGAGAAQTNVLVEVQILAPAK